MRRLNMGFTPYARAILGLYTLCECKIGVKNPPYPAADTRHLQRASAPPRVLLYPIIHTFMKIHRRKKKNIVMTWTF